MLFKACLVSSSFLVAAHESYQPDQISMRVPESIAGLEAYGIDYRLDLAMPLTSDFFFEQIVSKDDYTFHEQSILAVDIDGRKEVPKWVLWFTAESNPNFRCGKCTKMVEAVLGVANELQIERPELNFRVGKVNCVTLEAGRICDYLRISGLPRIIVLRPDLNSFYRLWIYEGDSMSTEGILNFVLNDYPLAFGQGELDLFRIAQDLPFIEGFHLFMRQLFSDCKEEVFFKLKDLGFVEKAVDDYTVTTIFAVLTFLSPVLVIFYMIGVYTCYQKLKARQEFNRQNCDSDPDFVKDCPFEEADKKND